MRRRVRDYIEVSEHTPLDELIAFLKTAHETLSENSAPELFIRGDHIFGQRLTIAFWREPTVEEAACEARYNLKPPTQHSAAAI